MNDGDKGVRVRRFFDLEAEVLYRKFKVMETLNPAEGRDGSAHSGEEGRYVESILRGFLNHHLPADIRAFSGFVLKPSTKIGGGDYSRVEADADIVSRQLDVIVYDVAHFPIYERFEEVVVVPPEGVVGVISVKKTLRIQGLRGELESLRQVGEMCASVGRRGPYLGVFAFTPDPDKFRSNEQFGELIFKSILEALTGCPFAAAVNEVIVFDALVAFKYAPFDCRPGSAQYVRVDVRPSPEGGSGRHVPLQRLIQSILGVYYQRNGEGYSVRPGFVSFEKGTFGDAPSLGQLPLGD